MRQTRGLCDWNNVAIFAGCGFAKGPPRAYRPHELPICLTPSRTGATGRLESAKEVAIDNSSRAAGVYVGEELFSDYIGQRPELHAIRGELSGDRRPDFTVDGPAGRAICEVFSPRLELPEPVGMFDSFGRIEKAFKGRKRKQGAQAKKEGLPYVVVVASDNSDVPYGAFELLVGATGRGRPMRSGQNTRFSALAAMSQFNPTQYHIDAWLKDRVPEDADLATIYRIAAEAEGELTADGRFDATATRTRLKVVHNPWAATPLPLEFFGGPHDEQFRVTTEKYPYHLECVWEGERIFEVPDGDHGP